MFLPIAPPELCSSSLMTLLSCLRDIKCSHLTVVNDEKYHHSVGALEILHNIDEHWDVRSAKVCALSHSFAARVAEVCLAASTVKTFLLGPLKEVCFLHLSKAVHH
jgi:hypothetical protein